MHKFPIYQYKRYSELPLEQLKSQRFSIYLIDFEWKYLFVNDFVCQNLEMKADDFIGKNMWEVFPVLQNDPDFSLLKRNCESKVVSNIISVSPVTGQRINITGYPLEDCYYFSASILPEKNDLIHELRNELKKTKLK